MITLPRIRKFSLIMCVIMVFLNAAAFVMTGGIVNLICAIILGALMIRDGFRMWAEHD